MTALESAAAALPQKFPGPGGAVAVLRDGEILLRHSWGWANAERRIAFTPRSLFRICSITKQFTCATLLDAFPDPAVLDSEVRARLPRLGAAAPAILQLCHNQSGLRDYWAIAMLHGSPIEAPFGGAEAARVIAATASLQFTPGTRYSYANQNFRILSDILEHRTGQGFADLLRTRIFAPAAMGTAMLAAETSALPDGATGYEGTRDIGFRPAENHILWTGDAGIAASLDDMIAWERHIDATRNDPASLYNRLSAPVTFADGATAAYGFGLSRRKLFGRATTGHGGALRGWRSHRLHAPADRLSVVVLFNHLSDASEAATDLFAAALNETRPPRQQSPAPSFTGAYIEPATNLAVRIDPAPDGQLRLRYGHTAEWLDIQPDHTAGLEGTRLVPTQAGLTMHRPAENQSSTLQKIEGTATADIAGHYRCDELNTGLTIENTNGTLYGAFSGFLGQGRMELLHPIAEDLWALPCPRALDHTPPGDWTLRVNRATQSIILGCWLARNLSYSKK